jgi:hypothetical protein
MEARLKERKGVSSVKKVLVFLMISITFLLSTPDDEYTCLVGRVIRINPLGSPEHDAETANETDDVHVNFLEFDYSKKRIREIEDDFSSAYGDEKCFDECSLDDVIMNPACLIRITDIEEASLNHILQSGYNAACYCYGILGGLGYEPDRKSAEDLAENLFNIIDSAVERAGYKVLEGDNDCVYIKHIPCGTHIEIKVDVLQTDNEKEALQMPATIKIPGHNPRLSADGVDFKMSEFAITRIINGKTVSIKLTNQELLDAYACEEYTRHWGDAANAITEMEDCDELYGHTADALIDNGELMGLIISSYDHNMEKHNMEWYEAVREAVKTEIENAEKSGLIPCAVPQ